MAKRKLERLLDQAKKAYQKRDKRKGARLIDEILQQDFNHRGTWELLYELYGTGERFELFQHTFASRFFPERLGELEPIDSGSSISAFQADLQQKQKKPSFFHRLFRRGQKAKTDLPAEISQVTPDITGPALSSPPPLKEQSHIQKPSHTERPQPVGIEFFPSAPSSSRSPDEKIRIVLVDDIAQTRETIVRTLRFQENFDVVGTASNGLQAIQLVRQLKPDVVVMDVNMPDMDGITATANIKRDLPNTEIVILTVQDDMDYMRRAMLAGARDFLAKPPMIDELVQAVERAGEQAHQQRLLRPALASPLPSISRHSPGKIVTVYSPRGGSGCTLLAVNLALGLHREENPAVIVDTDLQFGDVPVLFNTQSRLSILDLAPRVDELDSEIVSEVLVKHPSGVKILHPPRPERAELVTGPQLIQLSRFFATLFPYVILDTAHRLSDITLAALDVSDLIVLVSTLDIPSIARVRKFIELVPLLSLDPGKIVLVVNQFDPRAGIEPANLPQAFGIEHSALIPLANALMIGSVNDGIPVLAKRANIQQPAGAALVGLVKQIRQRLREMDRAPIRAVRT